MAGARRLLPTHVVHGGLAILNQKPRLVRLAHGAAATVLIAYSDVPTGYERCPTATEILVRPGRPRRWLTKRRVAAVAALVAAGVAGLATAVALNTGGHASPPSWARRPISWARAAT